VTKTIALAGKGGTGKTTISALLIRAIARQAKQPLLAIDADPSTNLHMALGLPMPLTVGEIREQMMQSAQQAQLGVSISRHDFLTHQIRMALEEGDLVDLLAMGRPEGQGCYCAANHLLREIIDALAQSYPYVVIDNEAGMEHISRRTTRDIDLLLVVTDPTIRGVRAAAGIMELAREIEVNVKRLQLVVNRVVGELPPTLKSAIEELDCTVAAYIPDDQKVRQLDAVGEPLLHLDGDSAAHRAMEDLSAEILRTL
jgi:CO dehydrogenase maturation factor